VGEVLTVLASDRFEADPAWIVRAAMKSARRRSGLSFSDFAAVLGVPPRRLRAWEEGDAVPPADVFVAAVRLAPR
jgi:DNA-binding transcriptional regulator YiaG